MSRISHFKDREVRSPTLQMVHELELKRRSYGHLKTTASSCAKILQQLVIFAATSQWVSQLRNWCHCAAEWHSCAKTTFAIAKHTRRGFYSAAEWVGSKMPISQKFPSPCEISQSSVFPLFLLCFGSNFGPIFFFSISLKFLPPGII